MAKQADENPIVPVLFRVWTGKDGGGVIALFPADPFDRAGVYCSSYEHVGQHGSADLDGVIASSRPATPAEYAPLKRELEGAPYQYRLRVVKRASRKMREQRQTTARA